MAKPHNEAVTNSKEHYHVLDGLRGVAAIVILIFHYVEIHFFQNWAANPMAHGLLAVDFFFCLSGFVIAYAYDDRIERIGAAGFLRNRLIRLHPLVIIGTILGFLGMVFDPFAGDPIRGGWGLMMIAFAGSLLLIPTPILPRTGNCVFPYNSPAWSLFLEYVISVVYALFLRRLSNKWLCAHLMLFGVILFVVTRHIGEINYGWNGRTFWHGFIRVGYSFTAGMCIYRFNWIWENRGSLYLPLLLMLGIYFIPHWENDWIAESLMVVIGLPAVVVIGSGASADGWNMRHIKWIR